MKLDETWWKPATKILQALFYVNAAIWLIFSLVSARRMSQGGSMGLLGVTVLGVLMLGNAAALALAGWGVGRQRRLYDLLALALLGINILLTFTDQMGLFDWLTFILDLVMTGLLIAVMFARRKTKPAG